MYRYFVAYTHQNSYGFGSGNCEVKLSRPICTMQDVNDVTDLLRQNGIENPRSDVLLPLRRHQPRRGPR